MREVLTSCWELYFTQKPVWIIVRCSKKQRVIRELPEKEAIGQFLYYWQHMATSKAHNALTVTLILIQQKT